MRWSKLCIIAAVIWKNVGLFWAMTWHFNKELHWFSSYFLYSVDVKVLKMALMFWPDLRFSFGVLSVDAYAVDTNY